MPKRMLNSLSISYDKEFSSMAKQTYFFLILFAEKVSKSRREIID